MTSSHPTFEACQSMDRLIHIVSIREDRGLQVTSHTSVVAANLAMLAHFRALDRDGD